MKIFWLLFLSDLWQYYRNISNVSCRVYLIAYSDVSMCCDQEKYNVSDEVRIKTEAF